MHQFPNRAPVCALVASTCALGPTAAEASGFALLEQSASRLGTAFAGTGAAADDATTIYFNPAGMTRLEQAELVAVASGIEITSQFGNRNSAPALGQALGGNGGDAGDWNFVPSAYAMAPLGERFAVGLGFNAPFGLKLIYEDGWIGRFQGVRNDIKTLNFNPSIAYALCQRISLGLGVSYQRLEAELTNAVNYSAAIAQGVQQLVAAGQLPPAAAPGIIAANLGLQGNARVRGDDEAWGFNVGLLFDLSDRTRIGLSYRSSVDYEVKGTVAFTAPALTNPVGAAIVAAVSAPGAALSSGSVSVDLEVPDSALLSLRQQLTDKVDLLADVAWTAWSSVPELRIVRDTGAIVSVTPERWEDVWRYALGATYELNDALTLRVGVAYDETPVPDATRTPRLPDPDRTWTAIGVRWQTSPSVTLDFAYAHLFSDSVPLNQSAGNTAAAALVNGEQESDIDIVAAQLVWRF